MTTPTRWAIALAVCIAWAWSAVDGPSDHEAAEAVEADRIEAIQAAMARKDER